MPRSRSSTSHSVQNLLNRAKRVVSIGSGSVDGTTRSARGISLDQSLSATASNEKGGDPEKDGFVPSGTTSGSPNATPQDEEKEDQDRRRDVRAVPPWASAVDEDEEYDVEQNASSALIPHAPTASHTPHHQYMPTPKPNAERGRQYDHERSWEPVIQRTPFALASLHWQPFGAANSPPRLSEEEQGMLVDEQWQRENIKDLEGPWNPNGANAADTEQGWWLFTPQRRSATAERIHQMLMRNPFVPLCLRLIVLMFVLSALANGVTIWRHTTSLNGSPTYRSGVDFGPDSDNSAVCEQQPSTYMAFITNAVAVLYLAYITWDEYFSKPLGLRRSRDKMRLLFLDLIFIVVGAATLSLAFNTLLNRQWACYQNSPQNQNNAAAAQSVCVKSEDLCRRQKALSGLLLVALFAWVLTFAVSISRIVERISR